MSKTKYSKKNHSVKELLVKSEIIEGVTNTGFKFKLNPVLMDDMIFMERLAEIEDNPLQMPKILTIMLGEKQKKALYRHCQLKDGRVPIERVMTEFTDIMQESQDLKK